MRLKSFLWRFFSILIAANLFVSCGGDDDNNENEKPLPQPDPVEELTFRLEVENIKAHGADLMVIPSEKNKKYFADIAPASKFENKTEEDIINMITGVADDTKLVTGDIKFKAEGMDLEPQTEYVFFAMGVENGKPTSKLKRRNFVTAEEEIPLPSLNISGSTGDKDGNNRHSVITINVKSDIAESLVYVMADNIKENGMLDDDNYVEKIINERGSNANEDEIKALNSADGMYAVFENLDAEHQYIFIARVTNKTGSVTKKFSINTESAPLPPKGPEIYLTGNAGDENGENKDTHITFSLKCSTNDVYYAEMIVSLKSEVDKVLEQGLTLEELASANKGNGLILSDEEINMVNNGTYNVSLDNTDGVIPDTEYTCVALVENFMGVASVARHDVKTEKAVEDNTPPTVEVKGHAGDAEGNNKNTYVTYIASCTSKNASYAEAFVAETSFINDILKDMTMEDLMNYNAGIGKVLEQTDLDKLNDSSLSLSWDQMLGDTEYTLLLCVKTKSGMMVVKRCDVKTAPDPAGAVYKHINNKKGVVYKNNIKLECSGKITRHLTSTIYKGNSTNMMNYNNLGVKVGILPGMFLDK